MSVRSSKLNALCDRIWIKLVLGIRRNDSVWAAAYST